MDADIIIIGGGGAGMCAALEIEKQGLRALILEADTKLGGATALCSGVYYAAGTSVQRANGIVDDTPDAMYEYIMTLNQWMLRPEIIHALCDHAAEGLEFLIGLGADFPPESLVGGGRFRMARGHSCTGKGGSIADHLIRAVEARPIAVELGVRVDGLIVEDGCVVGARAGGRDWRARSVILTTGGFGNNPEMLKRLFPSAYQHGDKTWAVHEAAPFILGDGIVMAEAIGAAITGHDTGMPGPTACFGKNVEGVLPPWIVLVNAQGRRFMAETSSYSTSGYTLNAQTGSRGFAIFDEKTLKDISDDLDYIDPLKQNMSVPSWHQQAIREQVARGVVLKAETLDELAAKAGIAAAGLKATLERYNADCETGFDRQFDKNTGLYPVRTAPFYAVEVRANMIGLTAAGLDIDAQTHVLDEAGRAIPGLYSAGEVLGCVIGARYPAGGVSIANAVVFGRIAGQTACADARANDRRAA